MKPLVKYRFADPLTYHHNERRDIMHVEFYLASDVDPRIASHATLVNSLMAMIEAYEHTIAAEYGYGWEKIAEGKHYLQAAKAALAAAQEVS